MLGLPSGKQLRLYPITKDKTSTSTPSLSREEALSQHKHYFVPNVHLFIACSELILSDSRMFLSPVYFSYGLSTEPLAIGVYVLFWMEHSLVSHDRAGRPLINMVGSLFSGRQACLSVDEAGRIVHAPDLLCSWQTSRARLRTLATSYEGLSQTYQHYSLHDLVICLLRHQAQRKDSPKHRLLHREIRQLRQTCRDLEAQLATAIGQNDYLTQRYEALEQTYLRDQLTPERRRVLRTLYEARHCAEFLEHRYSAQSREQERSLKQALKQGRISPSVYQAELCRLRRCTGAYSYCRAKADLELITQLRTWQIPLSISRLGTFLGG